MQATIIDGTALEKRLQGYILPLLILLAAVVYWNTLPNDFVAGDRQFILRNKHIGEFSTVLKSFTSDYWGKLGGESFIYYRPLVILTHFIDCKLFGLNPAGHHFSNIVFHCMVTLTVYLFFLSLLAGRFWPAFAGAALFALHPIHTHSVSYVMGRTDILATLLYLWSLILLAYSKRQHVSVFAKLLPAGACVCFLCALLCKEIAITLPLVFILYYFCWDTKKFSWKDRGLLIPVWYLMATVCFYLVIRIVAVGLSCQHVALPWYSVSQKIWLVFKTLGFYIAKLLFPVKLCYYSNMVVPGSLSELLTSPFLWTSMFCLAAIVISMKHSRPLVFALGWILSTLLPVLNIIPLPDQAKENYLYLPSIGFCLFFTVTMDSGMNRLANGKPGNVGLVVSGIVLIGLIYAAGTINRNLDYKTPLTFLESTIKTMAPVPVSQREDPRFFEPVKNFFTTYKNLGIIYQGRNQPDKAISAFQSALEYVPSYFSKEYANTVKALLASLLGHAGRVEEASLILKEALPFGDTPAIVNNRPGMVLNKVGNNTEAEFCCQHALMQDGGQDR